LTQHFRNRLIPLAISTIVTFVGSFPYLFLTPDPANRWLVYPCALITGVGIAMMLNTGTSLISDVIGTESSSSAFVYGIYSFLDKMANGIMLYFLVAYYSENAHALRWIMATVPISAAVGTTFFTWLGLRMYSDKLAKMSVGSVIKKPKATAIARKGSVA